MPGPCGGTRRSWRWRRNGSRRPGLTVLDKPPSYADAKIKRLSELRGKKEGAQLNVRAHRKCPGHAAAVDIDARTGKDPDNPTGPSITIEKAQPMYVCTDWQKYGHQPRYDNHGGTGKTKLADMPPAQAEVERAKRKLLYANNAARRDATVVRRTFVKELLERKTAPKGTAVFLAATLAHRGAVDWSGDQNKGFALSRELLGVPYETPA